MTEPLRFLAHRASRAAEALESLRARCGEQQANVAARVATLLAQTDTMHKAVHSSGLSAAQREAALCAAITTLQSNIVHLSRDIGVAPEHVNMLLPLIQQDVADAVRGVVHPPHEGGAQA